MTMNGSNNRSGTDDANAHPVLGKYRVLVNQFVPCEWCSIFNTAQFFDLHKSEGALYFQLCVGSPSEAVGVVHFTPVEAGHYRSPRRGTFGSFEFRETLRMEAVEGFVDEVERVLKDSGANVIEILEPPAILDPPKAAVLYNILCRRGYQVQIVELDCTMAVDKATFLEKAEYSRRKRINKCLREGMVVRQLDSSLCPQIYEVIAQNRAAKGFPLSMTCEAILKMNEVFPDRMVFFGAFAKDTLIASSICINIGRGMLYVFYCGDLPGYEKLSPVSLISQGIYDYARANGFSLMGIGTSTKDGIPNYGLISFKREMGCTESLKLSFVKRIA
jgi:hypothetical protein